EWMAHGELERAQAAFQATEKLVQEGPREYYYDVNDWAVVRFRFASELARRKGDVTEGVSLAAEALATLKESRHRIRVLPSAIELFVDQDRVSEARDYLDEYLESTYAQEESAAAKLRLAHLQALVAKAEQKPYGVINLLQPLVVSEDSRPELWRLLAEAYSRTDQSRRALSAMKEYLRLRPGDLQMTLHLTREHCRLRDWSKAYETAQRAESLDPTDTTARLLRIEAAVHLAAQRNRKDTAKFGELLAELGELRREYPERHEIHRIRAAIATYSGQPDRTERELKLAIEKSADPLTAEMQLVKHYHQAGRKAEAIKVCQSVCERHSEAAEPWILLSELHVANLDHEYAGDCLRQGIEAVSAKSDKRSISISLALLELTRGDRTAAIRRLSELAAQDEQEIRARTLLLGIREVREDPATAKRLIAELEEIEGEGGLLWRLHEASFWLASGDWRSKQQDITDRLKHCLASDPGWLEPVLLLANLYERLGDFSRFEDTCRQALARDPSAISVANRLLTLLERQARFSEAEQVLKDLRQFDADPRLTSDWQVRMAVRSGDTAQAIEELKLRISNDAQDANSRIQLAHLVYGQTRDADLAFQYLDQAEGIAPDLIALTAARVSILTAEGRAKDARQILDDYVAKSNAFGAYMMRAAYLAWEGQFEHAEQDYKKLITFTENGTAGYELLSDFYARNEKLDEAVTAIEAGLRKHPEDLTLKRRQMQLLFARGQDQDRETALEILAILEQRLPQDPELMKVRAMQTLQERTPQSVQTAKEMLRTVIELVPTAVDAHLALIRIAMEQGEYETASNSVTRALGLNPDNLALLAARGRVELMLENTRMAAELAKLVLQKDPSHAEARDLFVAAALASSDRAALEKALVLIEATDSFPTDEGLLVSRARVLSAMERHQAAIPLLDAYCQTAAGGGSVLAIVTLADLYRLSGDMSQAEQWIKRAEEADPTNQTVVHARFLWLVDQQRYGELTQISSAYVSATEQNPTTAMAAASILATLNSIELKEEGVKLFEHVLTLSPTLLRARLSLASTLYQTGDVERAEKIYRDSLAQDPYNAQILNDLAWILQERDQDFDAALELADKALSIDRDAQDLRHLLDTRGTILSKLQRFADARIDFERLVELSPPDTRQRADALLQLGRLCAGLNEHVQAKQHLDKALEIDQRLDVFTADERSEIMRITQDSLMQTSIERSTSNTAGSEIRS
ncbi:MAG: tetratricopeptide repeat protein, partial [Planctomycetota bacterium]